MKKTLMAAALLGWAGWVSVAGAGTLFTFPIIMVSPQRLNFGAVPAGGSATNTLLVQNVGGGRLVGKAKVAPPFKIISGADYNLKPDSVQVVTITYSPSGARKDSQTVTFTGGNGARAIVTGHLVPGSRPDLRPRPEPSPPPAHGATALQ